MTVKIKGINMTVKIKGLNMTVNIKGFNMALGVLQIVQIQKLICHTGENQGYPIYKQVNTENS